MKRYMIMIAMILCFSSGAVRTVYAASTPPIITFQGQLKESGYSVTGTKSMRFEIVNASGTVRWQSHASNGVQVAVEKGVYTVGLGDTSLANMNALTAADLDKNEKLYLRVYVQGVQLSPDILLSSSAYAFIAGQAETITANTAAGNSVAAALRNADTNVGIGKSPAYKLDVAGTINAQGVYQNGAPLGGDPAYGAASGAPADTVFIRSDGNVGINKGNPQAKLHVLGDIYVEDGGYKFLPTGQTDPDLILYRNPSGFAILRRWAADYTLLQLWAPPNSLGSNEATLALVRGDEPNQEYIDVYNNGYPSETQYGIRMQKRGTGQYRDFVFDQSDGTTKTEVLRLTASGNVGIGTSSPGAKLEIAQTEYSTRFTGNQIVFNRMAGNSYIDKVDSNNIMIRMGTGNTTVMTITNSGNVGIGTASPGSKLQVGSSSLGSSSGDSIIINSHPTSYTGLSFGEDVDNRGWIAWIPASNYITIGTRDNATTYTDGLTVRDNNVGVGVSNPTARLHIGGTAGVDGIRFPDGTLMTSAGVGSASNLANAVNAVVNADSDANGSGAVRLQVGGVDKLVVTNNGNVGIGTTNPSGVLHLANSGSVVQYLTSASDANSLGIFQQRARGTLASPTDVANGDFAGGLNFYGYKDSVYRRAAALRTDITGTGTGFVNADLLFFTANGSDSFQERVRITSTGNVGIGTAGPTALLHVTQAGTGNYFLKLGDVTAGVNRFVVDGNGNVGIGTMYPGGILDVERSANDDGPILRLGNGNTLAVYDFSRNHVTGALSIQGNQGGANNILLAPTSGNVGIGTASPQGILDIRNNARGLIMSGGTGGGGDESFKFQAIQATNPSSYQHLALQPLGGNVGIGTTDPGTDKLDVRGRAYASGGWQTTDADYAEWFEKEGNAAPGDIIGLNLQTGKARKYQPGDRFIGIYSKEPAYVGNRLKETDAEMQATHLLVGLLGQLEFNKEQVLLEDRIVRTIDGKEIGILLSNGKVLIGK
jgi:hypothetical protein